MVARVNYHGVAVLLQSKGMQEAMGKIAERVMARAIELAPVDLHDGHPGRYKASFSVSTGVQHKKTSRAYGRVTNSSPEALIVEYGDKTTPCHRTLGKALDAANGRGGEPDV